MICLMMTLENGRDRAEAAVDVAQDSELWDCEMFPGDKRERGGKDRAQDLRNFDDPFTTKTIGEMTSRQGKADDGNGKDETDEAERRC